MRIIWTVRTWKHIYCRCAKLNDWEPNCKEYIMNKQSLTCSLCGLICEWPLWQKWHHFKETDDGNCEWASFSLHGPRPTHTVGEREWPLVHFKEKKQVKRGRHLTFHIDSSLKVQILFLWGQGEVNISPQSPPRPLTYLASLQTPSPPLLPRTNHQSNFHHLEANASFDFPSDPSKAHVLNKVLSWLSFKGC